MSLLKLNDAFNNIGNFIPFVHILMFLQTSKEVNELISELMWNIVPDKVTSSWLIWFRTLWFRYEFVLSKPVFQSMTTLVTNTVNANWLQGFANPKREFPFANPKTKAIGLLNIMHVSHILYHQYFKLQAELDSKESEAFNVWRDKLRTLATICVTEAVSIRKCDAAGVENEGDLIRFVVWYNLCFIIMCSYSMLCKEDYPCTQVYLHEKMPIEDVYRYEALKGCSGKYPKEQLEWDAFQQTCTSMLFTLYEEVQSHMDAPAMDYFFCERDLETLLHHIEILSHLAETHPQGKCDENTPKRRKLN